MMIYKHQQRPIVNNVLSNNSNTTNNTGSSRSRSRSSRKQRLEQKWSRSRLNNDSYDETTDRNEKSKKQKQKRNSSSSSSSEFNSNKSSSTRSQTQTRSWSLLEEEMSRAKMEMKRNDRRNRNNESWTTQQTQTSSLKSDKRQQTALAVDYGLSKTGLAVSDFDGIAPRPIESIFCKGKSRVWLIEEILRIGERECVDVFVVGLPHFVDEDEQRTTTTTTITTTKKKNTNVANDDDDDNKNEKNDDEKKKQKPKTTSLRMDRICTQFAEALAKASEESTKFETVPVEMYDESFTSEEALSLTKRSKLSKDDPKLDSIAAALMLARYFEKSCGEPIIISSISSSI